MKTPSNHAPTATETRTERDSMGELQVPADALWGAQTQRAVNNFPISGLAMPRAFIRALGLIKGAAAAVNHLVDQRIDQHMARTRARPMAQGRVGTGQAVVFALLMGGAGMAIVARSFR